MILLESHLFIKSTQLQVVFVIIVTIFLFILTARYFILGYSKNLFSPHKPSIFFFFLIE